MPFKCEFCNREFGNELALAQHNQDRHDIQIPDELRAQQVSARTTKKRTSRTKLAIIAIIPLAIFVVYSVFSSAATGQAAAGVAAASISDRATIKGSEHAPVVIEEYSDFECPFCTRFFFQTEPQLEKEYINNGKVKFVYNHFPVVSSHPRSQKAAEASECAAVQGKFWEYHDTLFQNNYQGDRYSHGTVSQAIALFKKYAKDLGLDADKFAKCLDNGEKSSAVLADLSDAQGKGVRGTPSFLINGRLVVGAQPFSVFRQIIEDELAKSGKPATTATSTPSNEVTFSSAAPKYNLDGIPDTFVHYHADIEASACGQQIQMPRAPNSRALIGKPNMHTHDAGIIHSEGVIKSNPAEHTIAAFLNNVGIKASEDSLLDYKNGDSCPHDLPGKFKLTVNDQVSEDGLRYIPRDKDSIKLEFS